MRRKTSHWLSAFAKLSFKMISRYSERRCHSLGYRGRSRRLVVEPLEDRRMFATNLIMNGGFETAVSPEGDSFPQYPIELDHWTAVNTDGEMLNDGTRAYQGNGFLSVLQNAGLNPLNNWLGDPWAFSGYDRVAQLVDVTGDTTYTISFFYRGGDGLRPGLSQYTAGNLYFQIEQLVPTPEPIFTTIFATDNTWRLYSQTFTTPVDAETIVVRLCRKPIQAQEVGRCG